MYVEKPQLKPLKRYKMTKYTFNRPQLKFTCSTRWYNFT